MKSMAVMVNDTESMRLQIWDTSGQESFMSLIQTYFRNCQGAVIVFDLGQKDSVNGLPEIVEDFKNKCPEHAQSNIALIGNKVDSKEREFTTEEGRYLA